MKVFKLESSSELTKLLEKNNLTVETVKTPILGEIWKPFPVIGDYGEHIMYGKMKFTSKSYNDIYKNFKNNTLGQELPCNHNHNGMTTAVFWFHDLRKVKNKDGRTISLEYLPKYTPDGIRKIIAEELKYLSPEYSEDYKENGALLWGAAATNEPFFTGEALMKLNNKGGKNMKENNKKTEKVEENNELEELKLKIAKLELQLKKLEEISKIEKKEPEVKKIEAEKDDSKKIFLEQNHRIIKLESDLLNSQLLSYKKDWYAAGVPKPVIDLAEKRILSSQNRKIKLESTEKPVINFIEIYEEVFAAMPKILLEQQGKGLKIELETVKKTKEDKEIEELSRAFNRMEGIEEKGGKK